LGGAVVAKGKNRDAQISQVENFVRFLFYAFSSFNENILRICSIFVKTIAFFRSVSHRVITPTSVALPGKDS
jgi:hypothetical protein